MIAGPDPRVNACRPDLAASELHGKVEAARFTEGRICHVRSASAPLRHEPRPDAGLETEALCGEAVTVFDEHEGWAWAQLEYDRYVGYLPSAALAEGKGRATHRISALRTFIFPVPDIKRAPLGLLSMNALVDAKEAQDRFLPLVRGGFVAAAHVICVGESAGDFVAVAERFLGTPYLWGGRSSLGLDCSALVQLSLQAAGVTCPRDSDMQEAALGKPVDGGEDMKGLRRGDLVFWKGHVGIMRDADTLLHANAFHMETASEPLHAAVERIAAAGLPITSMRRLG